MDASTIQSEPGHGTRIEMLFPICESEQPLAEAVIRSGTEPPHAALDVLVVDDDELVYRSIQAILETLGHRPTSALSGEEALARVEAGFRPMS